MNRAFKNACALADRLFPAQYPTRGKNLAQARALWNYGLAKNVLFRHPAVDFKYYNRYPNCRTIKVVYKAHPNMAELHNRLCQLADEWKTRDVRAAERREMGGTIYTFHTGPKKP